MEFLWSQPGAFVGLPSFLWGCAEWSCVCRFSLEQNLVTETSSLTGDEANEERCVPAPLSFLGPLTALMPWDFHV